MHTLLLSNNLHIFKSNLELSSTWVLCETPPGILLWVQRSTDMNDKRKGNLSNIFQNSVYLMWPSMLGKRIDNIKYYDITNKTYVQVHWITINCLTVSKLGYLSKLTTKCSKNYKNISLNSNSNIYFSKYMLWQLINEIWNIIFIKYIKGELNCHILIPYRMKDELLLQNQ